MFPMIVSYSALGIGLNLFYRKKVIAQFNKKRKKYVPILVYEKMKIYLSGELWWALAIKKKLPFLVQNVS